MIEHQDNCHCEDILSKANCQCCGIYTGEKWKHSPFISNWLKQSINAALYILLDICKLGFCGCLIGPDDWEWPIVCDHHFGDVCWSSFHWNLPTLVQVMVLWLFCMQYYATASEVLNTETSPLLKISVLKLGYLAHWSSHCDCPIVLNHRLIVKVTSPGNLSQHFGIHDNQTLLAIANQCPRQCPHIEIKRPSNYIDLTALSTRPMTLKQELCLLSSYPTWLK